MQFSVSTGRAILAAVLVLLGASAVSAQNWQGGLDFQIGLPTGEYKDQIDKTGLGVRGDILWSPHRAPFGLGISMAWYSVGRETRKEPFSTTIPDVTVDVETENAIAQFMALFRVQPKKGDVRPYADALVGWNYLYTQTRILNASNGEEVASSTNFDDNAFAYGVGGGLLFRAYTGSSGGGRPLHVYVDLNFRYTIGGEAQYLKEGSIRRDGGNVVFDVTESKTNLAGIGIGVAVDF